jgi:hypothetical protein
MRKLTLATEDGAEDIVEFRQSRLIADRGLADRHGTHMTDNIL